MISPAPSREHTVDTPATDRELVGEYGLPQVPQVAGDGSIMVACRWHDVLYHEQTQAAASDQGSGDVTPFPD